MKQSRKNDRKPFARSHHGCTNCRKSKVKCDQQKPSCTRCWQKDLQCSSTIQLKWESTYRERGVAFGRSGVWGKGPKNKQSPAGSPGSSTSSSETTWVATPTIQPWTFVNNDMVLMQRLCDEEQGETRQQLLPPFDAKSGVLDRRPRGPMATFSQLLPLSNNSRRMDEASIFGLPLSPSLFPSLDELGNRLLFDYYINQICPRTSHGPLSQSPFASVILPYCVSAPPTVLRAIQALAACHWSQYDPQYSSIGLRLKSRVLKDFRSRINADQKFLLDKDPEVLVIAMFLCLFDIVDDCDPQWIIHLQGAKDIIRLRRRQQIEHSGGADKATDQDAVSSFVEHFFAFQDVMGRTACAKADLFGSSYWREDDTTIDSWMGCSPALVSILFSVMDLSRSRRDMVSDEDQRKFSTHAVTLNEKLRSLEQEPRPNEDDLTIHKTAELKKVTCIVFLKCALYGGQPSDPEIKNYVRTIIRGILELLALDSASHVIWPLFVAAVELDPLDIEVCSNPDTGSVTDGRRLVLELLETMARSSVSSVSRTRMVIEQVWKSRDLDLLKSSFRRTSMFDLNDWEHSGEERVTSGAKPKEVKLGKRAPLSPMDRHRLRVIRRSRVKTVRGAPWASIGSHHDPIASKYQRKKIAEMHDQEIFHLVCLTCKLGKRKCDRRLPMCSRCKKLDKICEYPTILASNPIAQSIQPGSSTHSHACERCKAHKRKCDRMLPKCSRCLRIEFSCAYQGGQRHPMAVPGESGVRLSGVEFNPLEQNEIGTALNPPIRFRSYMPQLLQFFLTSIALPSDTVVADSLASHVHSQWMPNAMSDPCLFHATLFSASAAIDLLQEKQITTRTLYHQTWVIRLINERLAQSGPTLTYGTLGAVIPLLYYNMVALDRETAVTHQKGLVKMLLATPKTFRAEIGSLIGIVKIAMLSFSCIYDMLPIWNCLYSESVRPNTLVRNVVSRITFENTASYFDKQTVNAILDVYEATTRLDHVAEADQQSILAEVGRAVSFATPSTWMDATNYSHELTPPQEVNLCCQLSCQIFWEMLRRQYPLSKTRDNTEEHYVQDLMKHLTQMDSLYWIRIAPEMLIWAAFTGAAASKTQSECAAFVSYAGTILTAVDSEELTLTRQGWRYFVLLKRLGGNDHGGTVFGND